jgi:hypothetical protein
MGIFFLIFWGGYNKNINTREGWMGIGILGHVKITSQDAHKCLFELLVGQSVAEWIHRAVGVAQEVGEHVEMAVGARWLGTEALDQR